MKHKQWLTGHDFTLQAVADSNRHKHSCFEGNRNLEGCRKTDERDRDRKKEKEIWRLDITAPALGARNKGVDFGSSQSSN
jgi:hypothetical protein